MTWRTHAQDMVLQYGADDRWSGAFANAQEHAAAWARSRDRLLMGCCGRRPAAWWQYEAGDLRYPGFNREKSVLYMARRLSEPEVAELETRWRAEFERAWSAGFLYCDGAGPVFTGPVARKKHFRWADIPPALVKQWTAQRRRRNRTVRRLEKVAAEPAEPPTAA
jgi:hypothetical protein